MICMININYKKSIIRPYIQVLFLNQIPTKKHNTNKIVTQKQPTINFSISFVHMELVTSSIF